MKFLYEIEYIAEANANENFSCDESLIGHKNNSQLWLIGIINNSTKDYRIEATFQRDVNTMKEFITKYTIRGNNIITDGFSAYNFLNYNNSGYRHFRHINGKEDLVSELNLPPI